LTELFHFADKGFGRFATGCRCDPKFAKTLVRSLSKIFLLLLKLLLDVSVFVEVAPHSFTIADSSGV